MSRCPTTNFQFSMSKWFAKNISTNVSFKITTRKDMFFIDNGWPWIWNQCFYLGIWNDDRTEIILLPSFQFATRLNTQNTNETVLLMNSDTLICLWILVIPICIIEVSTLRKCCFWIHFFSLHDYWPPSTRNPLVHTSWGEMIRFENMLFTSSKCEKRKTAET